MACALFAGLDGHLEKRNRDSTLELDPDRLDVDILLYSSRPAARPAELNELARVEVECIDDLRDRFVPDFYFGCEADDPPVAWTFRKDMIPLGARLRPVLGSDISHWDVRRMTDPVAEDT